MQIYNAPLRDMRFALNELHQDDGFGDLPGHEDFTPDLVDAVLEEAARLCQDVLLPLNRSGDEEGCHWEKNPDGTTSVRTPRASNMPMTSSWAMAGTRWCYPQNGAGRGCQRRSASWWRR